MKFNDIKIGMKLKLVDKLGNHYKSYDIGDIVIVTKENNSITLKTFSIQRLTDKNEFYLIPNNNLVQCWEELQLSMKELMD